VLRGKKNKEYQMALTGMQVYKSLPKTNCKDCGFPTCMAFAMQVAAKQKALTDCPHISSESQEALSEASAPPMKLVKIGSGEKGFDLGQETVMFRHEEKFHRASGIAVRIPASLSDSEVSKRVEEINNSVFERVGSKLKIEFCAIEVDGTNDSAGRAKLVADKSNIPVILIGTDSDAMSKAVDAIKSAKPLIFKATSSNIDKFSEIASNNKLPLAIQGASLEELSDLTDKAKRNGVEEIILAFDSNSFGDTIRSLTICRRAALKNHYKPFGYPAMVEIKSDSQEIETIYASSLVAKYAGIVIIDNFESWELLPIMTAIQDIYTDPQVPNMVEAKLYEIGNPDENSPVLFTTNFSLTYFSVAGEVERSRVPAYISVVDTEGLGVLNAYAGDKISVEKIIKTMQEQKVSEKVKHRKLIIPGLLPVYRAEIEDTSEWKEVIIGPESANKIPAFLNNIWK
jgi:acetyl-CoA decarbonylase/synthase complex subunit gamma